LGEPSVANLDRCAIKEGHRNHIRKTVIGLFFRDNFGLRSLFAASNNFVCHVEDVDLNAFDVIRREAGFTL
jgi:hypothetical protein